MSHTIYAKFENRDMAELAASRLKRKDIAFVFAIRDDYDPNVSDIAAAPASMSLLFPYSPINYSTNHTNTSNYQLYGKAMLSSETLGLPIYGGGGEAEVKITVDDDYLDDVHSILRNCGGYSIH